MGSARRFRRSATKTPRPDVIVSRAWRGEKPAVVIHAQFEDLAHYGAEMFDALRAAYEAGMRDVVILAIHRMSEYARLVGVDKHPEPFVFQGIGWERAVELDPTLAAETPPKLPNVYAFLATESRFECHMMSFQSDSGMALAWKFSPEFRQSIRDRRPDLVDHLIQLTGVQ